MVMTQTDAEETLKLAKQVVFILAGAKGEFRPGMKGYTDIHLVYSDAVKVVARLNSMLGYHAFNN